MESATWRQHRRITVGPEAARPRATQIYNHALRNVTAVLQCCARDLISAPDMGAGFTTLTIVRTTALHRPQYLWCMLCAVSALAPA